MSSRFSGFAFVLTLAVLSTAGAFRAAATPAAEGASARRPRPVGATIPNERRYPARRFRPLDVRTSSRTFRGFSFDGHVHTAYSHDARHPVPDVLALAERVGLDAVMITDHGSSSAGQDVATYEGPLSVIVGAEIGGTYGHALTWRFLDAIGLRRSLDERTMTMRQLGDYVHERGALVVLAHPGWWIPGNFVDPRYFMQQDVIRRGGAGDAIDAVEVWNGTYPLRTASLVDQWVSLLERSIYVPAVGGSDFHEFGGTELGEPRNVVLCEVDEGGRPKEPLAACIFEAARTGRLYVTDGPSIELTVGDRVSGEILRTTSGARLDVHVRVDAPDGGVFSLYLGREPVQRLTLAAGQPLDRRFEVRAPSADSFVWADVERPARIEKKPMRALLANPVRIDVGPEVADWRGPAVTEPPRRPPPEFTRAGRGARPRQSRP